MPLTITRRHGESIRIGPDITVVVRNDPARNGRILVTVDAPRTITIIRSELNFWNQPGAAEPQATDAAPDVEDNR